ncbi:MAG: hypothetical protein ACLR6B_07370 [Blautia sp.]
MRKGHVIYCNRCGRQLKGTDGTPVEEGLHVEKAGDIFREKTERSIALISVSPVTIFGAGFSDSAGEKEQKILI